MSHKPTPPTFDPRKWDQHSIDRMRELWQFDFWQFDYARGEAPCYCGESNCPRPIESHQAKKS